MPAHLHAPLILQPPADLASRFPHVLSLAQQLSLKYVHRYVVTGQDLQTMGDALWQTLGVDEALAAASQAAGTRILPLIVESADPLVQSLPWECLHHPEHGFLGKHPGFSLTRRLSAAPSATAEPLKGPLKVLLFTALPDDLDQEKERLDTESEQANVLEALDPLIHQGLVQLTTPDDGRFDHFRQLLRDEEFHLVFLSGHGEFNADPLLGETGAWFLFEGADGRGAKVEGEDLAQAFSGTAVQAVVLSACQSGKSASVDLGSSLATRLLHAGLPHVVGMRESILDVAGIHFAHALCKALSRQERLDVALQAARGAIAEAPALAGPRKDVSGATEQSWGQWCLPLLYSRDPAQPLIDWQFQPVPPQPPLERYHEIAGMPLPTAFIGRRRELRELGQLVYGNRPGQCLLTGAGGQGKTSLAGRLAQRLENRGWRVRAYTARRENTWSDFVTELQFCLAESLREQVNRALLRCRTETDKARLILRALMQQTGNRLALVFDNLETLQDPATGRITDDAVAAWLDACKPGSDPAPVVLVTSRWAIPGWEGDRRTQRPLGPPLYGDFLRYHQQLGGAPWGAERLRRLYEALGGNFKGLEFFHALNQVAGDDEAFLQQLEQSRKELQLHMAVEKLVGYLQPAERELLNRLRAYLAQTFADGVRVIAQDLAEPERLLRRLVGLSLVDVEMEATLRLPRYRLSPVVADWLQECGPEPTSDIRQRAARYQHWIHDYLLRTLDQALIAHEALRQSGLDDEAARFALDRIVPRFDRIGLYHTLLKEWLPTLRDNQNQELRARALNQSGKTCLHVGQYDEAKPFLEESRAILRAIGDRAGEGATLNNLSQIYKARGDYDTALRYLEESLAIQRAIGDRAGEGTTLNNLSQIYDARGDYDTALRYLEESLAIRRAIGDRAGEGATLNNLSQIYKARGDYDTALRYLEESLAIQRAIGDRAGEGTTLNNLSQIYDARGDYDTALRYLEESLAILRAIGDRAGEGATLNNLSQIYKARGDYDTALRYLEESLAIQRAIGDRAGEGTTLNNLSQIYDARGDYDTALRYLEESLAIRRAIGDRAGEGTTLNNLSQIYKARGDYDTALRYLEESLAILRAIGDRAGEGATLNNLSALCHARGDYDTALRYLEESLAILRAIGGRAGEGATLNNLSALCHARGDYDTALRYLEESLAIQRAIGDRAGEGTTLNNLSQIYKARGDYDTALRYLEESLAIRRAIGDRAGEGATLNNLSQIYQARGDYDTALRYLEESLAIRRAIGDRAGEGATLNNLSQIYQARGDYDTALRYLEESLAILRAIGDRAGEGTTLNNLSALCHARGDYDTALRYLEESLAIQRAIGDRAGLCPTLFNIGHLHWRKDEHQQALACWATTYRIAKEIGLSEALMNLEQLAKRLGGSGLEDWERLSQQMESGE